MSEIHIAIPYYSGAGHTETLANAIAEGVTQGGATATLMHVEHLTQADWQALDAAHGILFGTPTYMGGVAAAYAAFLEEAGERWMEQSWANTLAGGFTVATYGSGDKLACLQRISIFAAQMGMIWAGPLDIGAPVNADRRGINADGSWLGLMASSVRNPRGAVRPGDVETATRFGKRMADLALRLNT